VALHYANLVVWQRADDLFIEIHRLTYQRFPRDEQFELGRQLRRAAYSVAANIVEGSARKHTNDKLNFYNIASASLSELTYGLHAANRLGYVGQAEHAALDQKARMVAAPLVGLINATRTERKLLSTP
jgi:four helix bundle protein